MGEAKIDGEDDSNSQSTTPPGGRLPALSIAGSSSAYQVYQPRRNFGSSTNARTFRHPK
jgi:hypothetical protein